MRTGTLIADSALGAVAGIIASQAMNPVTSRIYEAQSEEAKARESEVSYGVAYDVAARKAAAALHVELGDDQVKRAGRALHYATGVASAGAYMLLRRTTGLSPLSAGLATGLGVYAVVDEGLNPLLKLTPPPQKYPPVTHLRGLAGHVVLGLALAAAVETGWALLRSRPKR